MVFPKMKQPFEIYKLTVNDAESIAASPNEPHVHDFEELLIGMEGRLEHFIDFSSAIFCSPYVSFITRGKLHRVRPLIHDAKCSLWQIRFASDFIPETTFQLYSFYHEHANFEITDAECFNRMTALCGIMEAETRQSNPKLSIVHDLLKALFAMIEAEYEKNLVPEEKIAKTHSMTFKNFLKILEENFRRPEGVDFYADKLFMSSRNLNTICQTILQKSVSEIIETRKLLEAKNLLTYSEKSISEIGFELGYNEKAYFTNVFKKKTGTTPTDFREEIRRIIS
jgi:AraC family transcriptional regulator, transcriptional activator of pobA